MRPFKIFTSASFIVGAVIGAGFITGKELVEFFVGFNPFISALTVFAFITCIFIVENFDLDGRVEKTFYPIIICSNFMICAGMISGLDSLFYSTMGLNPNYSIASFLGVVLCSILCMDGIAKIEKISLWLVPIMILVLFAVCINTIVKDGVYSNKVPSLGFLPYVTLNVFMASSVIKTTTLSLNKKEKTATAILSGGILGVVVAVVLCSLSTGFYGAEDVPLLKLTEGIKIAKYVYFAVALIAILTTVFSSYYTVYKPISKKGNVGFKTVALSLGVFIVSKLGFSDIVKRIYPAIGLIGIAYLVTVVVLQVFFRLKQLRRTSNLPKRKV